MNPDNKEPQMQQGQLYSPPQINNVNNQQITPQNNNNINSNNTPLNNLELNNQNLSKKRKKTQIILIILLYLSSIIIIFNILRDYRGIDLIILIRLIISILEIILASLILFYTIKNKSSRSICTSIIPIIICILDAGYFILYFLSRYTGLIFFNLVRSIIIISYDILIFIFNSSCNYGKCFD